MYTNVKNGVNVTDVNCVIDDFDFRYLCDRSTIRMFLRGEVQSMEYFDVEDAANQITGIDLETDDHHSAASCVPSYTAPSGETFDMETPLIQALDEGFKSDLSRIFFVKSQKN